MRRLSFVLLLVLAAAIVPATSPGASSTTVVSVEVPSATTLDNQCTADPARRFGLVAAGTDALTATGAGVCRFVFGSSNDTAMLRLGQRDRAGTAMAGSSASWTIQGTSDDNYLQKVRAFDSTLAFAVGRGLVWKTTSGGTSWTRQAGLASWSWFYDVSATPTKGTWWIAGSRGTVGRTTNATDPTPTWDFGAGTQLQAAGWPATTDVLGVSAISATAAWVSGSHGWVGKTTDGGATWTAYQLPGQETRYLRDIDAYDANQVMIVGHIRAFTSTGGNAPGDWTVSSGTELTDFRWVNASFGWGSGMGGRVVTWNGTSWTNRDTPVAVQMRGIVPVPSSPTTHAVTVGYDGETYSTTDAGASWQRHTGVTGAGLWSVESLGGTDLMAVGGDGTVVRSADSGASWTLEDQNPTSIAMLDVAAAPANGRRAVAVGSAGTIRRTEDGGTTWTDVASSTSRPLFGVAFGSDDRAWAVGARGVIVSTADGGSSWSQQHVDTSMHLNGVTAASARVAVAVGPEGIILRTQDGGSSWSTVPSGVTSNLYAVTAASPTTFVAVGTSSTILRSTDSGASWTRVDPLTLPSTVSTLNTVTVSSTGTLYTASWWTNPWRSDDGGLTWDSTGVHPLAWSGAILDMAAAGDSVWAVSDWGMRRRSTDRGATWSSQSSASTTGRLRAVHAVDEFTAYAVSDYGTQLAVGADAGSAIADYGTTTWSSPTTDSLFGACLQALGAGTSAQSWTKDADGSCTAAATDPWNAVPASPVTIASTSSGTTSGSVDLVWGFRAGTGVAPGTFSATVSVEVLAPSV